MRVTEQERKVSSVSCRKVILRREHTDSPSHLVFTQLGSKSGFIFAFSLAADRAERKLKCTVLTAS